MPITTFSRTSDLSVSSLLIEVRLELGQEVFLGRTHGKVGTYVAGCRGHLCRYRERTRRRTYRQIVASVELPRGVRPDTRPRSEQRWDQVLACIADCLCEKSIEDAAVGADVARQLGLDSTAKLLQLMESFKSVPLLIPHMPRLPLAQ